MSSSPKKKANNRPRQSDIFVTSADVPLYSRAEPAAITRVKDKPAKNQAKGKAKSHKVRRLWPWFIAIMIWALIMVTGVLGYFVLDLPDVRKVLVAAAVPTIQITDNRGTEIGRLGDRHGTPIPLQSLPKHVPLAFVAMEDRRFYQHFGLDLIGIMRAAWLNYQSGQVRQGGSTITQQLAKNLFLSPQRNFKRKVQEALLALWLEQTFSKDEILALYLNRVYFGAGAYGLEAAAQRYFAKPADRLELGEAALLAGLVKAPSQLSPFHNLKGAVQRSHLVLAAMLSEQMVSAVAVEQAKTKKVQIAAKIATSEGSRGYFVEWVGEQISAAYSTEDGDLIVRTSFDAQHQSVAEASLKKYLQKPPPPWQGAEGAVVILGVRGEVLAMVGGLDYATKPFNRAVEAQRQPGSAFKLMVFAAALKNGQTPDDLMIDQPIRIGKWQPKNIDNRYRGPITLTEAMAHSVNSVAVQLQQKWGVAETIDAARDLGIYSELRPSPSLSLGTNIVNLLEITNAYHIVAQQGRASYPTGVLEIRNRSGNILQKLEVSPDQAIPAKVAISLDHMLAAVVANGTGRQAQSAKTRVAGKTGTAQNSRDTWFIGYGGGLTIGVWVGRDDNKPMVARQAGYKDASGGQLPALIFKEIMTQLNR